MPKFPVTILLFFVLIFADQANFAQQKIQASFDYSDGKIFIFYEFSGDNSKEYDVSIVLKRTSDSEFAIVPEKLSGDIGEGKFSGKKCKIVWELSSEEESMLEGEDYYFDVTASEISSGGIPWYVFAGGAAVAGGTAAILLLGKKDNTSSNAPATGGFPTPPVRP
ncbi:MAG: hypothetical protein HXY50_09710 [Ignavibacteriaceae bacterium]|nr:hypothetical protein [Ignavibacteriaceae bacterium]